MNAEYQQFESTNMRVALLNNLSAEDFSKQLLTIGNGCVNVDGRMY